MICHQFVRTEADRTRTAGGANPGTSPPVPRTYHDDVRRTRATARQATRQSLWQGVADDVRGGGAPAPAPALTSEWQVKPELYWLSRDTDSNN